MSPPACDVDPAFVHPGRVDEVINADAAEEEAHHEPANWASPSAWRVRFECAQHCTLQGAKLGGSGLQEEVSMPLNDACRVQARGLTVLVIVVGVAFIALDVWCAVIPASA